jgi:hypothetical protein
MQKYDSKWARSYLKAIEKNYEELPTYNVEWPAGYQEAWDKYPDSGFDSVRDIWESLSNWHEYEKGSADSDREAVTEFHARILNAVYDDNTEYLKKLIKAIEVTSCPHDPELNGIRAAIEAFRDLFTCKGLRCKDQWPTKHEVRRRAEQILKDEGRALPVERHWSRIFKKAGLWELPNAPWGEKARNGPNC